MHIALCPLYYAHAKLTTKKNKVTNRQASRQASRQADKVTSSLLELLVAAKNVGPQKLKVPKIGSKKFDKLGSATNHV